MKDFNPEAIPEISSLVSGKMIVSVQIEDTGWQEFLVFNFTDGSKLSLRYDYIYEFEVTG
jgi:hypothetical protein